MLSRRNIPTTEDSPADLKVEAYLDAARACILDVGWRRTTLTEVARRAGVSRMTIYRTWPDMPSLLGDLLTREWATLTLATSDVADNDHPGYDLVETIVRTVHAARTNDFLARIVELDAELLLPYLLTRRGRSQEGVITAIASHIRDGQAAGGIRAGNPVAMARALVLALHGFVLSLGTMVDDQVSEADLEHEMRILIAGVLR